MKTKRRLKFYAETERQISLVMQRETRRFFCAACGEQSEMLSINQAAKRAATVWREIVERIESNNLHSTETGAGEIYVCAASLSAGKTVIETREKI